MTCLVLSLYKIQYDDLNVYSPLVLTFLQFLKFLFDHVSLVFK